jgi:hypothetical protein
MHDAGGEFISKHLKRYINLVVKEVTTFGGRGWKRIV